MDQCDGGVMGFLNLRALEIDEGFCVQRKRRQWLRLMTTVTAKVTYPV